MPPAPGKKLNPDMETAALDPGLAARSRSFDWTAPFAIAMVLLLAVLVLLPMFWLFVTS